MLIVNSLTFQRQLWPEKKPIYRALFWFEKKYKSVFPTFSAVYVGKQNTSLYLNVLLILANMFNINNLSLRFSKCHKHSLEAEIFWKSQFLSHEESPCWFIYEASIGRMCMVEAEGWDDTDSGGCILTTCSLRYYGTSTFVQIYSYVHVCFTVHSTY